MIGRIIAIDGMDGTGKETQSKLLYENLKNKGLKVKLFSFPNYNEDSSYFVEKYLKEGYCRDIEEDIPILHDIFYSIDRAITYYKEIKQYYEDGYIIIMDRYIISNLIFNLHRYIEDFALIGKYCTIIHSLENRILDIPKANLNIILYSDPEVNTKMIETRCKEENVNPDLNENLQFQTKIFENINAITNAYTYRLNFGEIEKLLIHDDNGIVYSREVIHDKIMKIIEKYI